MSQFFKDILIWTYASSGDDNKNPTLIKLRLSSTYFFKMNRIISEVFEQNSLLIITTGDQPDPLL